MAAVCRQKLSTDPMTGVLVVFISRRRHAIKCLVYDSQGFWLCQKRLSKGRFTGWPKADEASLRWDPLQLQALLWNGDPPQAAAVWKSVSMA